jgi:hypothetical protein
LPDENQERLAMDTAFLAASLFCAGLFSPVIGESNLAKVPADGIYFVHEKGDGPKVTRNDTGDHLILGELLTANFGVAAIQAINNSNT